MIPALWYNSMQENNLAMAVAALPVTVKEPAKPENPLIQLARMNRPRFILYYKEDSGFGPGYRLADIELSMHPVDFQEFIAEVQPVGRLDGHVIIYALDYVKWVIRKEDED
jgi:hypothetical protein